MAKKGKPLSQQPDETFLMGPFRVARFGSDIVWNANWSEDEFAKVQKHQAELYPKIVQTIDALVSEIADLVIVLPPAKVLHRAWWGMAGRHVMVETEAEIGPEDAVSVRMIDYVQSIIAAVPPAPHQRQDVTDAEWTTLREKIEQLFRTVNSAYHLSRRAKSRLDDPNFDLAFDEFQFKAQIYWCNVRGNRYQVHEPAYLTEMFLPHSDVLQELFGISGEQFVNEITKIWHALSFGIRDAFQALEQFEKDTMDIVDRKIAALPAMCETDVPSLMVETVKEQGWEERQNAVFGRLLGTDLFDLEKTTALPQRLLNELTWSAGEERDFFAAGEFRGWPLRIWPISKRPFIQLNGRYYCFDLYSLLDNLYRSMQRIILRLKPDYRESWNSIQQTLSEELPFKYLQQMLPEAKLLKRVFYRGRTDAGTTGWCEADGLLIYDDHLFVVEARGGAFTYTPPATDFPAYIASLRNLVLKPASQGRRFLEYMKSADTVALFDKNHNQIGQLRQADFRYVTICPVTLDPFTEMAAQVQHLRKIGVDVGAEPVWVVSVDDLRAYADIFENPLLFLHYVEQRMQAFRSDVLQSDDELDHLGLYLKHNHYSTYAKERQRESGAKITFHGYRSDVDKFFRERMYDPATPCPLKQDTPSRILEIIEFLSRSNTPGRAAVSSYPLDLGGDWREQISNSLDEELARQPASKRAKPFSTHGDVKLTVFCWSPCVQRDSVLALDHARTVLLLNNDGRRLLLELSYAAAGTLRDVDWQWVDLGVAFRPTFCQACEAKRIACVSKGSPRRRLRSERLGETNSAPAAVARNTRDVAKGDKLGGASSCC